MIPLIALYELSIWLASALGRPVAGGDRAGRLGRGLIASLPLRMLFDLRGRRRRVVQATYLMLAVLMGGGLVLFGIGGDVSGGLFDAFSERSGSGGNGNDAIEKRIERLEKRRRGEPAATRPRSRSWCATTTRSPRTQQESGTTEFPDDAKDELRKAASYWQRYLGGGRGEAEPRYARRTRCGSTTSARSTSRRRPRRRQRSSPRRRTTAASYLQLVAYAALAGDTRTADLATQKAVDLAPKDQKKAVKQQAEQLKQQPQQQQPGS